jgi:hypothetical protein
MKIPFLAVCSLFLALLVMWFIAQRSGKTTASIVSGFSIIGMIAVALLVATTFWAGCENLHHLEYQEYAPKADSFLIASDNAILYWGNIDGPIRSYAPVRKTFSWKTDDITSPKQSVVLEAKGSVWAAEKYRKIEDSLEKLSPEEFVGLSVDTLQTDPLHYIGDGIHPDFRYSDILIRGLLFWPAVRFKYAGPVYEGRWSIYKKIEEPG